MHQDNRHASGLLKLSALCSLLVLCISTMFPIFSLAIKDEWLPRLSSHHNAQNNMQAMSSHSLKMSLPSRSRAVSNAISVPPFQYSQNPRLDRDYRSQRSQVCNNDKKTNANHAIINLYAQSHSVTWGKNQLKCLHEQVMKPPRSKSCCSASKPSNPTGLC